MRDWSRSATAVACGLLVVVSATSALAAGGAKPVWAGHGFRPEAREVKITSAGNSASSFSFTWWVWGFVHEPGKGIDWVRFAVNADPTEIKALEFMPASGWTLLGPNTVAREHVGYSSGTTPFLNLHIAITGTETMQNSETTDVLLMPITVHFAYVSETQGISTTTSVATDYNGVGVDHHEPSPAAEQSWGWIKALFK